MNVTVNMTISEPRAYETVVDLDVEAFDGDEEAAREQAVLDAIEEAKDRGVITGADEAFVSVDSVEIDGEDVEVPESERADA